MHSEAEWAEELFGQCVLGDARRTERLVDVAGRMAKQSGKSLAKCCEGAPAALLGGYRFMRNEHVKPEAIRAGGFASVAQLATCPGVMLAVEDTTSLSYTHAVAQDLGTTGNRQEAKRRGYLVHSVLLLDGRTEQTLGLIEQQVWCREIAGFGRKHARKQRRYEEKESYKWERASREMAARLGDKMDRTISVCDRESDIYEYLTYKREHEQRFVVRAQTDRRVRHPDQLLSVALERSAAWVTTYTVSIPQRGGRKARQAKMQLRSMTLELEASRGHGTVTVNVVLAQEVEAPTGVEALRWVLLTSEAVSRVQEALEVVRYYTLRWRIEDFHKAWKTGIGIERQRFQAPANLERMLAITAFLAVRLLQLRESLQVRDGDDPAACVPILSEVEWKVLWHSTERGQRPKDPPSASWAYRAIAKLGGFADTKRTGRASWEAVWHGWFRLQERIEGFSLSQQWAKEM